ncbi:arylsulfatase [Aliiruegeria lutimaris]|uniref:Arylsulfatase n=2 Tax=Aliiruegeria lutimaris TaxID=571298 RepID=A0A1G9JSM7_9RHOB|nr:arylsulfatase [Aliiruegeria lutimaris]
MTDNQIGQPGYEGHINDRVVTVATLLRNAGYHTYMAGKWHLGLEVEQDPFNRGFERAFTLLQGGASHFGDEWMMYANYTPIYREDGVRSHVPYDFYSSEFYADKIMEYIDSVKDGQPFFAYLSMTAPHDPLHLPDDWLDRYRGRYDSGYEKLREERLERMKSLGIVPDGTELSRPAPMISKWNSLDDSQRRYSSRRMEIHAGMVENIDHHLGRVFDYLKRENKYDNTLILLMSDNGASPTEVHNYPGTTREWHQRNSDNRFENMGQRGSRISIGSAWALASNTPLRHFKGVHAEGGIRVPFIVSGPGVTRTGQIDSAFTHVTDVAPTILEMAGVSQPDPDKFAERDVSPMTGMSMRPFLSGKADSVRDADDAVAWESLGWRAVRQGPWKAVWLAEPFGPNDWQLFDMASDMSERNDLANAERAKLGELILIWEDYADDVGVVLPMSTIGLDD